MYPTPPPHNQHLSPRKQIRERYGGASRPLERHTCARPIPVLPAVPSTTVPPGVRRPFSSASLTRYSAALSIPHRTHGRQQPQTAEKEREQRGGRQTFDRPPRVHKLCFAIDVASRLLADAVEADQWGVSDRCTPRRRRRRMSANTTLWSGERGAEGTSDKAIHGALCLGHLYAVGAGALRGGRVGAAET